MCEVRAHCVRVRASFSLRLFVCLRVFGVFCPHVRVPLVCVSVSGVSVVSLCVHNCVFVSLWSFLVSLGLSGSLWVSPCLEFSYFLQLLTRTAPEGQSVEGRW